MPKQFDALHLLGVIALQEGRLSEASRLITSALEVNPQDAAAHNNLGIVYLRQGELTEARAHFERAIKRNAGYADALTNLGSVLRQLGLVHESVAPLRKAFALQPGEEKVCNLLGASLLESGDAKAAVKVFEAAVRARPDRSDNWINLAAAQNRAVLHHDALGSAEKALSLQPDSDAAESELAHALAGRGQADAARERFQSITRRSPNSASAFNNLGAFLRDIGEIDEAVRTLERAVALQPDLMAARENLILATAAQGRSVQALAAARQFAEQFPRSGVALAALGSAQFDNDRLDDALRSYEQALKFPDVDASVHLGYGNVLMACGDADAARKQYRRAIELDASSALARWALAMSFCQPFYRDARSIDESRKLFSRAVADLRQWARTQPAAQAAKAVGSTQPFYLAYHPCDNRPLLAAYGDLCADLMQAAGVAPAVAVDDASHMPLRVGIISAHIRDHSVWNAITRGWVDHIDRSRFDLYLFHLGAVQDAETQRVRRRVSHFFDGGKDVVAWARLIADQRLDVLIYPEVGMDALTTKLASLRLARVQAASWGHPETTGLPTMDLYLSAELLEAPEADRFYAERLVRLPHLGVCVDALRPEVIKPDLASLNLPANEPLLLCAGSPFKYSPAHDAVWVDIARGLHALGRGRLVFFRSHRRHINEQFEGRLRGAFARARVDFDARVCIIDSLDRGRFFGLMSQAALMLDTLNFSGFNTALQGLECGLPVLAHEGPFMRSRLASALMRRIGLDELVATTNEAFVARAIELAGDDARRTGLRAEIERRRSILFGDLQPVRALEETLMNAARA